MDFLKPKIQANGLVDVFAIGITKAALERAATPIIGNGSIKSGAIKGIAGVVIHGKGGKIGSYVSNALIIDATEDIVQAILPAIPVIGQIGAPAGQGNSVAW